MKNTDNDTVMSSLLATLRSHAPAKVRAYSADDEYRDIAVPTRRKRWGQVVAAIEARSWVRVELLDKGGAVLAYVENAEPARDVEDIESKTTKTRHDAEWIVKLCMTSVKEALQSRDEETKSLLSAQGEVVREMVAGFRAISEINTARVDAAKDLGAMQATAAAGNGDFNMKELMEALPVIMQALPALKALLAGGNASPASKPKPAPANGANGVSHG